MALISKQVQYKDFDLFFRAHPITGKLNVKKNVESIKQAVKNLLLTNLGERPYKPNYGSSLRELLFQNFTQDTLTDIEFAIRTAIENYEPRVQLLDIKFNAQPDNNSLQVGIVFLPINSTEPVVIGLDLQRVR